MLVWWRSVSWRPCAPRTERQFPLVKLRECYVCYNQLMTDTLTHLSDISKPEIGSGEDAQFCSPSMTTQLLVRCQECIYDSEVEVIRECLYAMLCVLMIVQV